MVQTCWRKKGKKSFSPRRGKKKEKGKRHRATAYLETFGPQSLQKGKKEGKGKKFTVTQHVNLNTGLKKRGCATVTSSEGSDRAAGYGQIRRKDLGVRLVEGREKGKARFAFSYADG